MSENRLQQLQRLGIDLWVTPQRARDLIAAGEAKSLSTSKSNESLDANRAHQPRTKSWTRRVALDQTTTRTTRETGFRSVPPGDDTTSTSQEESVEQPASKPFEVQLRVFLYGSVAIVIEYGTKYTNPLISDILRALNGFEEHQINELHFKFPLTNLPNNVSTIATLAGAQEGFQAWFVQRAPQCEKLLIIGSPANDTTARLHDSIPDTISRHELPVSRADKQQLWNQIKHLNV